VPIQAVESQRLYQQVAEQIGELIRRGEFRAGDRLPAERDLARQLGVSRPVVREAMIALEIAGLVEVRTGAGIFVTISKPDGGGLLALTDVGPSPSDLIAARKLLEPEIAFAAAASVTDADLAGIAETLDRMEEAVATGDDIEPFDRLFHARIAAATRNTVLTAIVDQLWESMLTPLFSSLHLHTGLPAGQRTTLSEHRAIFQALRSRDGATARDAMRRHLARVEAILLSGDVTIA
jgi:DNA-binding FadR family transcriptional regulator